MTEPTDTPAPPAEAVSEAQEAAPEATEADTADDDATEADPAAKARKEAAAYRRRLRDTETERDALRGRLETMQRAEVERLAAEKLATPSDLWLAGTNLADLLDDDGNLDAGKVTETLNRIVAERPHWSRPAPDFDGGLRQSAPATPGWASLLRSGTTH
jgi:hypothetical protein